MAQQDRWSSSTVYDHLLVLAWHFSTLGTDQPELPSLSFAEFLTLRGIQQAPECPVRAVCATLGVTKSGASRIVKRLEQKGYVTTATDTVDGRVKRLALTSLGTHSIDTISAYQSDKLERLLVELPDDAACEFDNNLRMIVDNLHRQQS